MIAGKLQRLFDREAESARATGDASPTPRSVADRICRSAGDKVISKDTIRILLAGRKPSGEPNNPTVTTLDWLARGFGITSGASYFLDDTVTARVDSQLDQVHALGTLKNDGVTLAMRASGLSEEHLGLVQTLVAQLQEIEAEARGRQGPPGTR